MGSTAPLKDTKEENENRGWISYQCNNKPETQGHGAPEERGSRELVRQMPVATLVGPELGRGV